MFAAELLDSTNCGDKMKNIISRETTATFNCNGNLNISEKREDDVLYFDSVPCGSLALLVWFLSK